MDILMTCKVDFEKILAREVALYDFNLQTHAPGWVLAYADEQALAKHPVTSLGDMCFACEILLDPCAVSATSVNSLTAKLVDIFITHIGQTRIVDPWGFCFLSSGNEQLIHHVKTVEGCWLEKLRQRMSRVAKLAREGIPRGPQLAEGFFVHCTDFNQARISFRALSQGQQRMKMDPQAPSRSYLKLEEAFHIFGYEPQENDQVIDLGAAPGGWSYSALRRGAMVTAIDNGPLREPVRSHPRITHLMVDALKYQHDQKSPVDWLLCDVLESPDFIINLLRKWFGQKWCRRFVVNLKIGRLDPICVLRDIRDARKGILPYCQVLQVRQLYHDREEITLMGEVKEADGRRVLKCFDSSHR